jgi:hypothetical protein
MSVLRSRALLGLYSPKSSWSSLKRLAKLCTMIVEKKLEEANSPSIFDILNIFRCRWFLNRDHLISNILSAQKDEHGKISWVDFQPMFHTHLIW